VFANDQDYAYGRFLLDAASQKFVLQKIGDVHDVFSRSLLWGSLWNSVREAELAPREFIESAIRALPSETDESLAQNQLARINGGLNSYVSSDVRAGFVPGLEAMAADRMLHAPEQDFRILWYRSFRSIAETPAGREKLKEMLREKLSVPGVEIRPLDRWNMVMMLLASNDSEAGAFYESEKQRDTTGDGAKYAWIAGAVRPDAEVKQKYFDEYLHNAARPEDWIEGSLGWFNYWNQTGLTLPYLKPALDALPQMKRQRKSFFVLAWLNTFIGGQQSTEAQTQVRAFLAGDAGDADLKRKVTEVADELDRTVRIRAKYNR